MAASEPRPGRNAPRPLRCPACGAPAGLLATLLPEGRACAGCGFQLAVDDGIVRALAPERREHYRRFLDEYGLVRDAEGRGSDDAGCYLALPYRDLTGRNVWQWKIRARTYRVFENQVLPPLERERTLDALDLGAGNGWLSYRLALRGHRPIAIDVRTDARDGLGAARRYFEHARVWFPRIEAELDAVPFEDAQFDLAVFNASFHYAPDADRTLAEALRCLKPDGRVVIMDTPIYRRREDGERMREERKREFLARYGFASDALHSIEFLDEEGIAALGRRHGLGWETTTPWYGVGWLARPWKARLAGRRPPSRFAILVGRRR